MNEIEKITYPSFTYKLNAEKDRILSYTDGMEAVKQAIYKVISTERNKYPIYSQNYGIELEDLFGQEKGYVRLQLVRRITECLLHDNRITSVEDFTFPSTDDKTTVHVKFKVVTIFGDLIIDKEVNV